MVPVSLVLNAGSSSIKFQLYEAGGVDEPRCIYRGLFDGLGSAPHFVVRSQAGEIAGERRWGEAEPFGHEKALAHLAGSVRTGVTIALRRLATESSTAVFRSRRPC